MISEGSIDILLRTRPLQSSGSTKTSFDMFESESGQDLTLSPQTFTNSTEAFINDNSNSLGIPATDTDTVGSTEDAKGLSDSSKLVIKKARPKASSPNRQGPQQCQEFDRAQPGKVCGKVFGNASALAKHKLTHSDERKYACNVCGKAFKRQDHLNGHMLTHRNKKPYECKADGCGKSYCDARSLRRHTENHHSGGGVNMVVSSTSPTHSCIQYAPPTTTTTSPATATRLQRLLASEPPSSTTNKMSPINDGLTKHQLDLIHQIMQQTQQRTQVQTTSVSSCSSIKTTTASSVTAPTNSPPKSKTWAIQTTSSEMATKDLSPSSKTATPCSSKGDPKPVECNLCHRKFKNVPALNGHMRLHGGYFKKESDAKKGEKKESTGPPLQTASMSVRALIEEKIIQKRITSGLGLTQNTVTYSIPVIHSQTNNSIAVKSNLLRRHSDSQFSKQPRSTSIPDSETPSKTVEQKHVSKAGVRRASSDPGSLETHSRHLVINDQCEASYPLGMYSSDDGLQGYFSPTMQEVQSVQDSMLLQGVGPKHLADSIQVASLQDIHSLDESQDNSHVQRSQDIQSVLSSPIQVNLANFGYSSNPSNLKKDNQSSESTHAQSTQPTLAHTYPTSLANQEGSPSFDSSRLVVSLARTSPLSTPFYPSAMSTPTAFEGSFNDINPLGSVQHVYPPPQSPLSATPVPSPLSLPTTPSSPIPQHTLQSQMMPNSDDPLLSSSPKDFTCRKRFDFQTFKFLNNGTIDLGSGGTGIVVDRNGDLKLIQPLNTATLSNGTETVYVKTKPKMEADLGDNVTKGVMQEKAMNKIHEINNVQLIEHITEEMIDGGDVFLSPSSLPARVCDVVGTAVMAKKRPRQDTLEPQQPYYSKLRTLVAKHSTPLPLPYTPPPMLLPSRSGQGLYWQVVSRCPTSTTSKGEVSDGNCSDTPESDSSPHINVGPQFQCSVPPWRGDWSPSTDCDPAHEHLLWDPGISKFTTDSEVDMYLEFACCAAVPGGGRNKEYALHLLHLCHGNVHDAMLKLMQPTPLLPSEHPLLSIEYTDCDRWSDDEMDAFHKGVNKFDKDFTSIAHEVGTKNSKQCVQFYYLWKKICPEDYKRIRLGRRRNKESEFEFEFIKSDIPVNDWELVSTSSESRLFVCEYPDCSASFNSRAALNGHIRIHGGGVCGRSPTPDKRATGTPTNIYHSDPIEEFPCKICGKVFNKVKSRSAHMKSHRPPDAEPKKAKQLDIAVTVSSSVARPL